MDLIADFMLVAGACAAGFYCIVLSRRLRRFTDLEKGVGGAVAVLSAQVDDLNRAVAQAQATAKGTINDLDAVSTRAEAARQGLELLIAATHDAPPARPEKAEAGPFFVRRTPQREAV